MTGPRDWDKELAKIDRLIAEGGGPKVEGPAAPSRPPATPGAPPSTLSPRPSTLGVWLRVGLGGALAAAMTQWPYAHTCGMPLLLYFGASGVVLVAGLWAALASWRRRMGLAHLVALAIILWGMVLAATVVLPRTGYARTTATWLCQ